MLDQPLPITLYPSRLATLFFLLVSVGFTGIAIWMIASSEPKGWFVLIFAIGIPIFLLQLHPRCSYLCIRPDGIQYASLFKTHFIKWDDIQTFGVCSTGPLNVVGMNFAPHSTIASQNARAAARLLAGFEGALPDNYGRKPQDLANLLTHYHHKYKSPPTPAAPTLIL